MKWLKWSPPAAILKHPSRAVDQITLPVDSSAAGNTTMGNTVPLSLPLSLSFSLFLCFSLSFRMYGFPFRRNGRSILRWYIALQIKSSTQPSVRRLLCCRKMFIYYRCNLGYFTFSSSLIPPPPILLILSLFLFLLVEKFKGSGIPITCNTYNELYVGTISFLIAVELTWSYKLFVRA